MQANPPPEGLAITVRYPDGRVSFVPPGPGMSVTLHLPEPASFFHDPLDRAPGERDDPASPNPFRRPSFTQAEYQAWRDGGQP